MSALGSAIDAAFDEVGLIGTSLRDSLRTDIAAKILVRQARDVVLLTGVTGAGKEKVAATMHAASASQPKGWPKLIVQPSHGLRFGTNTRGSSGQRYTSAVQLAGSAQSRSSSSRVIRSSVLCAWSN